MWWEERDVPGQIVRVSLKLLVGHPERRCPRTRYIVPQNLTIRMQMRRFTRLTNAFSKKLENVEAAVALLPLQLHSDSSNAHRHTGNGSASAGAFVGVGRVFE
jgi:hypothetical protein